MSELTSDDAVLANLVALRATIDAYNEMFSPAKLAAMAAHPDGRKILETHRRITRSLRAEFAGTLKGMDKTLKQLDRALKAKRWGIWV